MMGRGKNDDKPIKAHVVEERRGPFNSPKVVACGASYDPLY